MWPSLDRRYITWLSVVTIAFSYNLWFIPVRMVFSCHTPGSIPLWFTADVLADLIYIIDMIIFQPRLQFCKSGDIIVSTTQSILLPLFVCWHGLYSLCIFDILLMYYLSNPISKCVSFCQYDRAVIKKNYRASLKFQVSKWELKCFSYISVWNSIVCLIC